VIPLTGDRWTISTSTDDNVDFTVWALQDDGLRAGAFDAHPNGNGRLRLAGLIEQRWHAWFRRVVRTASERADAVGGDPAVIPQRYPEAQRAQTAASMFNESEATRDLLLKIWPEYLRRSRERVDRAFAKYAERRNEVTDEQEEVLAGQARQFWEDLQDYRPLPPLHVYLVEYVKPVVAVVRPASIVIGLTDPQEDDLERYGSLVFEGASLLKSTVG